MSQKNNPLSNFSTSLADATEKAGSSTVMVLGRKRMPSSGILYAPDLVLTAEHTIQRDDDLIVQLADGSRLPAEVAGRDPGSDLALLRISDGESTPAVISQEDVRVGELVLALGRPSTSGIEASLGVISAIDGPARTRRGGMVEKYIRTDAVPLPGFSGGPLVNANGDIIGINTSGLAHGSLLTIPAEVAWKIAKNLAEHGSIKRGYLGIRSQLVELPQGVADDSDKVQETGLLVVHIEAESPASQSDLMVGDIITGVNGVPVHDHDDLFGQLVGEVVGQPTEVKVLRGGVFRSVEVVVGERPSRRSKNRRGHGSSRRRHPRGSGHHRHP
jgi:S1-C subfamily serine protease